MALTAVIVGVLVLAAAAFVLSYSGIHAIAQQAGISATLARGYPVIFDALLVITCAAVLSLRGAGPVSRFYAWLSLLVLLGATAGADALHSTGTVVPHRTAALAAAIIPWILLLIGFGLLLAMLRHARLRRAAAAARDAERPEPPVPAPAMAALPPGTAAQADRSEAPKQASPLELPPAADTGSSDPDPAPEQAEAGEVILAAPLVPQPRAERAEEPPFHRMWSTPTPPDEDYEG